MWEPGMGYFQVRLVRDGQNIGGYALPALDVDDAVARAKVTAAEAKEQGLSADNPFDNLDGLEVFVEQRS